MPRRRLARVAQLPQRNLRECVVRAAARLRLREILLGLGERQEVRSKVARVHGDGADGDERSSFRFFGFLGAAVTSFASRILELRAVLRQKRLLAYRLRSPSSFRSCARRNASRCPHRLARVAQLPQGCVIAFCLFGSSSIAPPRGSARPGGRHVHRSAVMISGSSVGTSRDASSVFEQRGDRRGEDAGGVAYSNQAAPSSAASAGRTRISRANRIGGADRGGAEADVARRDHLSGVERVVRVENASTPRTATGARPPS